MFRLDDSQMMGVLEARIPLEQLKREGSFRWKGGSPRARHEYMEKLGLEPALFLECDWVDPEGPLDFSFTYLDTEVPRPGDYYLLRVEQLDTNKAWSSPVWVN